VNGQLPYTTKALTEGASRGNLRITIPWNIARELPTPGWLKLAFADGDAPYYGYARRPPSRSTTVTITLAPWRFPTLKLGDDVTLVAAENAMPDRARAGAASTRFDWLPYVDAADEESDYFPVERDGTLYIYSRHCAPFALRRFPEEGDIYWALGAYQAEGSKATDAHSWNFGNTNGAFLRAVADALNAIGIDDERQYMQVIYPEETDTAEKAEAFFSRAVRLRIAAVRGVQHPVRRDGRVIHNKRSATIDVRDSLLFLRMTRAALADIFAHGCPTKRAAERYAIGWLDGDGNVVFREVDTSTLRLSGHAEEHRVVREALRHGLDWSAKVAAYRDSNQGTHLSMRTDEMLRLIEAGAFRFSLNRARLLVAFDVRSRGLRNGERRGAYARWGLVDEDGDLTDMGRAICAGAKKYEREIEEARRRLAASPKGKKGVPW
jgi:hypothetical protein